MIRIIKPIDIPAILLSKGKSTNNSNRKKYDNDPLLYAGKQSLIPKKSKLFLSTTIYGVDTVKKVLKDAQKGKCCFCEKMQNDEYGAVEHYRPKGGFKAKRKDRITKPGYFWLCYD